MDLDVLRTTVCSEAAEFRPESLTPVGATVAVEHWAAIERAAASAKLRAALRVDDAGLDGDGVVADASGTTPSRARRQKRAAAAASSKPGPLGDAFRKGQLSAEQTEAITSATAVAPEAEQSLVDLAQSNPTADLIEACNRTRIDALNKHGRLAGEQRARRYVRHWKDQYGMTRIDGALEPVAGATVIAALNQLADRAFRAAVRAKVDAGTPEQRLADALAELAAHGQAGSAGAGKPRRGPRPVVRIVVNENGDATVDGTPVPPEAVADVLADDDTVVQTVTRNGRDVTRITSHKRHIPKALRDALEVRDPSCVVPGCGSRDGLQIDHVTDYAKDGPTALHNLCRLCRRHHRLKTLGRYSLTRNPDGTWNYQPLRR